MKRFSFSIALILTAFVIVMGSCGGGGSNNSSTYQGTSKVTITVSNSHFAKIEVKKDSFFAYIKNLLKRAIDIREASAIPSNIVNIKYTVSGSGMNTITGIEPVSGSTVITLDVPNGLQRHFRLEALDANGIVNYQGEKDADLNGIPITLEIYMLLAIIDLYPSNVVIGVGEGNRLISFDVNNSGPIDANNARVVVLYNNGCGDSCQSFTVTVPAVSSVPLTVSLNYGYATDYKIIVDPNNTITEANESNNVVCSEPFCTNPPPLSICP